MTAKAAEIKRIEAENFMFRVGLRSGVDLTGLRSGADLTGLRVVKKKEG